MSFSATVTQNWTSGGSSINTSKTYTAGARIGISEDVTDGATDELVALVLDVSEAKAIILSSNQAVTIEFNNATTPDPAIVLVAGVPHIETTDSYFAQLLIDDVDITAMYVTNASGETATVKFEAIYDPTP